MSPQGLRVAFVTPHFHPAFSYGGSTESGWQTCTHLAAVGHKVRVLTTDADGPSTRVNVRTGDEVELRPGLTVRYCKRWLPHAVAPDLLAQIGPYAAWAEVIHLIGVYNFTTFPSLAAARQLKRRIIWTPRGGLNRWARSRKPRAKAVWEHLSRRLAPDDTVLHLTSAMEEQQAKRRMPSLRTVVIPNGVVAPERLRGPRSPDGHFRILFLGRLDPIKGIENLLRACALIRDSLPALRLTIAGSGNNSYETKLRALTSQLGLDPLVRFAGHVAKHEKVELFATHDLAVAPSFTENFGIAIAEALAHGLPVIASRGTPWEGVEVKGCGYFVSNDPASLSGALSRAASAPLREMGARGHAWMQREYSWPAVASALARVYARRA